MEMLIQSLERILYKDREEGYKHTYMNNMCNLYSIIYIYMNNMCNLYVISILYPSYSVSYMY